MSNNISEQRGTDTRYDPQELKQFQSDLAVIQYFRKIAGQITKDDN